MSGSGGGGGSSPAPGDSAASDVSSGPELCESGDDGWVTATSGGDEDSWGGTSGAEDEGFGMGDDMPLITSLYDVNQSGVEAGDRVEIQGVVVTSPISMSESGASVEFFVQEPDSGPYSGMRVRVDSELLDPPQLGDEVTLIAQVRGQGRHQVLQVIDTYDVEVTGHVALPEPIVVSTGELADPESEAALAYEGVVVGVEAVVVTTTDTCSGEFVIDSTLHVDDRYLLDGLPHPEAGQSFARLSGPLVYVLDDESEGLELAPRGDSDIQP